MKTRIYSITKSKAGHYTVSGKHIASGNVHKVGKLSSLDRARLALAEMKAWDANLDSVVF